MSQLKGSHSSASCHILLTLLPLHPAPAAIKVYAHFKLSIFILGLYLGNFK